MSLKSFTANTLRELNGKTFTEPKEIINKVRKTCLPVKFANVNR